MTLIFELEWEGCERKGFLNLKRALSNYWRIISFLKDLTDCSYTCAYLFLSDEECCSIFDAKQLLRISACAYLLYYL